VYSRPALGVKLPPDHDSRTVADGGFLIPLTHAEPVAKIELQSGQAVSQVVAFLLG